MRQRNLPLIVGRRDHPAADGVTVVTAKSCPARASVAIGTSGEPAAPD
jgi:hypothetical protein